MTSSSRVSGSLLNETEGVQASSQRKEGGRPPVDLDRRKLFTAIGIAIVAFAVLGYVIVSTVSGFRNDPRRLANFAVVSDSETGEVILQFPLPTDGKGYPAVNPKTGRRTLFPTEACFWTKEGKAKLQPNYVILNTWLGKKGPTLCPECGKTIVRSNPMPPDALMQQAWDAQSSTKK